MGNEIDEARAETTISELAIKARSEAAEVVARHKKHSSFRLYSVLATCLGLCELADRDPAERAELEHLFTSQPATGNRRYIERGSSIYLLVCRFVFSETDRTNAARYGKALEEAAKLQLNSETLAPWMRENGGVNALYFRRPLSLEIASMKTIRLARPAAISRRKPFTLKLRWRTDNTFDVLAVSTDA